MKLTDDWTLEHQPQERANVQLALYATHLATGSSLHFRTIKAATICSYLTDIAKFLGRFRDVDPRFTSSADTKLAPVIAKVIAEQKRWESVPNRREPFTLTLQLILSETASLFPADCCLQVAMADWTLCNMYAGCRGIEWAQTSTDRAHLSNFHRNRFGNAYAFTLQDVRCMTINNGRLTIPQALTSPVLVGIIKLRFEEQKNHDNGEWKLFTRNTSNSKLCFITAFLRILQRFVKLMGMNETQPLSVYETDTGEIQNITTADVERALRHAASKAYNLDPIKNAKDLQLWSAHSLRVGACATLYAKGFSEMEIKFLLRWKSNAFMTYLRNLAVTSRRHNEAMNDVSEIPNFL